jgi:hypothetical protein
MSQLELLFGIWHSLGTLVLVGDKDLILGADIGYTAQGISKTFTLKFSFFKAFVSDSPDVMGRLSNHWVLGKIVYTTQGSWSASSQFSVCLFYCCDLGLSLQLCMLLLLKRVLGSC